MENVPGMSTGVGKEIFKKVVKKLEESYYVEYKTLNAADYGVPQIRKRLVLHGIRKDVCKKIGVNIETVNLLPVPTHSKQKKKGYKKWVTVEKAILDLPALEAGESYGEGTIKNHATRNLSQTNIDRLQEIRLLGGNRELFLKNYNWNAIKKKMYFIQILMGLWIRINQLLQLLRDVQLFQKGRYCHPTQNRGLSIREAARLQSFDDKFEFCGNMGEMSLQIGNAVPSKLAQASGKVIINFMEAYENYLKVNAARS